MLERLVESWLDSQGERQYQPALVQALISDGWKILHNSRHSPIEYGRDIVARDKSGKLYALQLKGNPGTRLTKSQLQDLLPQIRELVIVPLGETYYATKKEKCCAVLVTNGVVDEEAEREVDLVRGLLPGTRTSSLEIWSRGHLLDLFTRHAKRVWPTTLLGVRSILELHSANGEGRPNTVLVAQICADSIESAISSKSKAAKVAAINQLAVLVEIMKGPWRAKDNHWGSYLIGVIGYAFALQIARVSPSTIKAFSTLMSSVWGDARALVRECMEKKYEPDKVWFQRDPFSEYSMMYQRRHEIADVCAALLLSKTELSKEEKAFAVNVIEKNWENLDIWGEAQIPGLAVQYMALSSHQGGDWIDYRLGGIVSSIASRQNDKDKSSHLPSPYYGFEDVFFHSNGVRYVSGAGLARDSFRNRSSTCWSLVLLLAKRNRKRTCRLLWPSVSKLVHESLDEMGAAFFSPVLSRTGHLQARTLYAMGWKELVSEACNPTGATEIADLSEWAALIAAYIVVAPHRASPGVILTLDGWLSKTWYSQGHLPPN